MYYRWKDGRVIVKTTIWGAVEGDAGQTLQHLAADVRARTSAEDTPQPTADDAVGITRNGPVRQVDEPERKFSLFFCHLPGDRGTFRDHPIDYKCVAAHAPVRGNRAFDTALESTDGVLMVVRHTDQGLEQARHAIDDLIERLTDQQPIDSTGERSADLAALFGVDGDLSLVILNIGEDASNGENHSVREALDLPASVDVVTQDPAAPLESASRAFHALTEEIAPRLARAAESGRLPV